MSNDQDENNHNSTDQISHLKTEENGGNQENVVSSTSSYASTPENRNKSLKRKNTNKRDSFYKKICLEDIGSCTAGKLIIDNEDIKMAAPMEYQTCLPLMVNNDFENYLLEQDRLYKNVIQEAENQQNSGEARSTGSIYSEQCLNPFQNNKITNSGENFDLATSKAIDTNFDENTRVNNDFRGIFLENDKKWNCKESADSENHMKFRESFFTAHESENSPSERKLHPTSIFSELSNETSNNLNEINNLIISETEDIEEQRAFLGEVSRDVDSRKSDIDFLILPSTSAYQCIENNETFTIPIEHMISINEAKKFTGTEVEHGNKVINTWSINLGNEKNNTEEQTSLPMEVVSYSNTINGKTFILNDEVKVSNMHPEMKEESNIDDTEALNFRISDVDGPSNYQEVISFEETTSNSALKLNKETYSSYRKSIFSEQDNVNPTAMFKQNSINKYNISEVENPYLESIISTGSGTLCGQVEEPMILDESTNKYPCKPDKEYTSYLQNPDYLENPTRSRESIILNGLEDNHDLMEYEIERLENDNCKILTTETLQLGEFKTGFESSGDIIMPNYVNSENNNVPTAIRQEAMAQLPNSFNVNSSGSTPISTENSTLDKKEIKGSIFTDFIRIKPTITNTKSSSTYVYDVLLESCLDQLMARPQGLQNCHNLQSSNGVSRKPSKEPENFIINKLILEYIRNKKTQEFTVQDIVKFVMKHNSSLPYITTLQSIRVSLENYTKTGILKFKTNGKYNVECDGTHNSFAVCSKKEKTGIQKCSLGNRRSKQNIEVEDNLQTAGNSMKASESHSTSFNDSIQ